MPVLNGIGHSGETATKQQHFRGFVRMHQQIARKYATPASPYLHFDLNAGDGTTPYLEKALPLFEQAGVRQIRPTAPGSSLIFLEQACQHCWIKKDAKFRRGLDAFQAVFFEIDDTNRHALSNRIGHCKHVTLAEDHADLPSYARSMRRRLWETRGLIYSDENGTDVPWDVLAETSRIPGMGKVDILIYYQGTAQKRVRRVWGREQLEDQLATLGKTRWLIREAHCRQQWTFLFGTNHPSFPAWEREGFYRLDSAKGQSIFEKVSRSAAERGELEA